MQTGNISKLSDSLPIPVPANLTEHLCNSHGLWVASPTPLHCMYTTLAAELDFGLCSDLLSCQSRSSNTPMLGGCCHDNRSLALA